MRSLKLYFETSFPQLKYQNPHSYAVLGAALPQVYHRPALTLAGVSLPKTPVTSSRHKRCIHTEILLQDKERLMFCLITRNRNQKSNIMRRQRSEFQTKEQNKTPKQTLMKWSLDKCLPDKDFKKWSKEAHQTWKMNGEIQWETSTETKNIRKCGAAELFDVFWLVDI